MQRTLTAALLLLSAIALLVEGRPQQLGQDASNQANNFGQFGGAAPQQPNNLGQVGGFPSQQGTNNFGGQFGGVNPQQPNNGNGFGGFPNPPASSSTYRPPQPFPPANGGFNGGVVGPTDQGNRPEWMDKIDSWWGNTKNTLENAWHEASQDIGHAASEAKEWAKDRIDDIKEKLDNNDQHWVGTDPRFNGEMPIQFPSVNHS